MADNLSDLYPVIIKQEGTLVLRKNAVMPRLVNTDFKDEVQNAGDTVSVPTYTAGTVRDRSVGSEITVDSKSASTTDVKVDKFKYRAFIIEDIQQAFAQGNLVDKYIGPELVALVEQVESDVLSVYSSMGNSVGTYASDIDTADITATVKAMDDNKVPTLGRNIVISSKDKENLIGTSLFQEAQKAGNDSVIAEADLGRRFGLNFYMNQAIPTTTVSGVLQTHNIAFHKQAIALAVRPMSQKDMPEPIQDLIGGNPKFINITDPVTGLNVRIIMTWSDSQPGVQVYMDILYGVKLVQDALAVHVKS